MTHEQELIHQIMKVCEQRGWSIHWTARGAYLHLECSELIEAWRGKHGDKVSEAADVLIVFMSILGAMGVPWNEVMERASDIVRALMVKPRYAGEESNKPPIHKVKFEFDERSLVSIEELKRRGVRFAEVELTNPETGESRTAFLPVKN